MFDFNNWIITIAGGSILISIFEIIAPFGKMKDFCKSIFGLFYIYIVINPILQFISSLL